jgi:hypothetical protein
MVLLAMMAITAKPINAGIIHRVGLAGVISTSFFGWQQSLNLRPLPQEQGSFRPISGLLLTAS